MSSQTYEIGGFLGAANYIGDIGKTTFIAPKTSVFGGVFGYGLGRYGGRPIVDKLFSADKVEEVDEYYQKYGVLAVGVAGFTPLPYKIFTITSGLFRLSFVKFIFVSIFSRSARFLLVGVSLYFAADKVKAMLQAYPHMLNILSLLFVIMLLGGFYLIHFIGKKKR